MIAERDAIGGDVAFQVNRADLGPLFVDRLELSWNPMSPLAEDLQGYAPGSARGSGGLDEVASHPMARQVATIVAQPDLRILHRSGGGTLQLEALHCCRSLAFGRETLVVVAPSFEDSIMLRLFPGLESYLPWWLDTFATRVEEPIPNFMPPALALESLLYLLHAIDVFRRVAYESLLEYAPNPEPSMKPAGFVSTMERSVRSRDIRWLLPTFLQLTPGLSRHSFEPKADHMDPLVQNGFLTTVRDARTGQETFLFGEPGRLTGVEFYRSWLRAVGFAPELLTARGPQMLSGAFLAPTALSNHLIRIEDDPSGRVRANHQAMTFAELEWKIGELHRGILNMDLSGVAAPADAPAQPAPPAAPARPVPPAAPAQPVPPAAPVADAADRCPNCGAALKPGGRFCVGCGNPVAPRPAQNPDQCSQCGNQLAPSAKFCPKCGAAAQM